MLTTNLEHIESDADLKDLFERNENVMVCCGRMGPMCTPLYSIMNKIVANYPHVKMVDMDFDIPIAGFIRGLPECSTFMGLPFTVYFKKGKVIKATTSIQTDEQVMSILNEAFEA